MDVAIAFHAVAALLLVWAGVMKLVVPTPAALLLRGLGVANPDRWVKPIGCVEMAIGCIAVSVGGPFSALAVSVVYALFALVVLRALAVRVPSCGCFGRMESPPSWVHVGGNLVLAGASLATVTSGRSPADLFLLPGGERPGTALALLVTVGVLAGLFAVLFTALPELLHARSRKGADPGWVRMGIEDLSRTIGGAGR